MIHVFFLGFCLGAAIVTVVSVILFRVALQTERRLCCEMFRDFIEELPKTADNRLAVESLFSKLNSGDCEKDC